MTNATWNRSNFVGDDYAEVVTLVGADRTTPINITGRTYTLSAYHEDGGTAATFTCTVPVGTDGKINISLSHTLSTALGVGTWAWALVENASGVISTLLPGTFSQGDRTRQ